MYELYQTRETRWNYVNYIEIQYKDNAGLISGIYIPRAKLKARQHLEAMIDELIKFKVRNYS